MISVKETKNRSLIKCFWPGEPNPMHDWLLINDDETIIGAFEIQPLTKITGNLHLHIIDSFQDQGYGVKAFEALITFLKEKNKYLKLIATIPSENQRIISIVNQTEARCCGLIKNGIIINNKFQDLIIFELAI